MSWYYTDGDDFYADGICYRLSHGTMVNSGMCPPESIRRLCRAQAGMGGPVTRDDQRREERPDGDGAGDGQDARRDGGAAGPSQDGREAWGEGSSMTEEKKAWYEGIPAPVDADRNVVPLTTQVMFGRRGDAYSMDMFSFDMGTKSWIAYFERRGSSDSTEVSNLRLKRPVVQGLSKPDSWERLLGDLGRAAGKVCPTCHYAHGRMTQCSSCRFYKSPNGDCEGAVLSEVARRIRDLIGEE